MRGNNLDKGKWRDDTEMFIFVDLDLLFFHVLIPLLSVDLFLVSFAALAAKRNRYQRQKSLMVLEMESQHAKGLPSPSATQ